MGQPVDKPSVRKIARISAKTGQAPELLAALRVLELATRAEPGCVEFAFFQAVSNDAAFVLLEHFASEEAFQVHMQMPHTQAFFKAQLVASVHAVDVPSLGSE